MEPQNKNQTPQEHTPPQVVVGTFASQSLRTRFRLSIPHGRTALLAGLAVILVVAAIVLGLFVWHQHLPPITVSKPSATKHSGTPSDATSTSQTPTSQQTQQGNGTSSSQGKSATGSQGSSGGGTSSGSGSGGSGTGSCSGPAHYVPDGPDGNGTCWPGPNTTGVPAGTTLTTYTGPCDIHSDNVTIDSKIVNCGGMLIYGHNFTIKNSLVHAEVFTNSPTASMTIVDSEIDGGSDAAQATGTDNVTILRANIHGNQHTIHCSDNCNVQDSWMHDQYDGSAQGWHENGFLTNGGSNNVLKHNSVGCVGGCTGDISLIPDGNIDHVTIDNNLLLASPASSYCLYGGHSDGSKPGTNAYIVVKNNVFQRGANHKCGFYGPVTSFQSNGTGNQWLGNIWDDGTVLDPSD